MKRLLAIILAALLCLTCFAGCGKNEKNKEESKKGESGKEEAATVEQAKAFLDGMYKKVDSKETPVDYTLVNKVTVNSTVFNIEWTVDNEDITVEENGEDEVKVCIPTGEDLTELTVVDAISYTLTATISDGNGKTITSDYRREVPQFLRGPQNMIVEQAYALQSGESMEAFTVLTGVIVVNSKSTPYDPDNKNVSYAIQVGDMADKPILCYRLKSGLADDSDIKSLNFGDTITVIGTITNYNGTVEFAQDCRLAAVVKGENEGAPTNPVDIVKAAYELPEDGMLPYVATLTGKVTEISDPYSSQYKNVTLTIAVDGCEDKPIKCYRLKGAGADAVVVGQTITVYGFIINFRGTIEFTAGCFLQNTTGDGDVGGSNIGTTTTAPSGSTDSTGSTTTTTKPVGKDPEADTTLTVKQAIDLGGSKDHNVYTAGKYYVSGEITEVYNNVYGNMKIKDKSGNILTIYGTFSADGSIRYDAMTKKPVAGDTITVYGIIGQYNGTPQVKNAWITKHTPGSGSGTTTTTKTPGKDPAADSTLTVKQAIDLGASKAHNTYTAGKYYVSGKVTSVDSTQYGNMKIADEQGNVLVIYGSFGPGGNGRFGELNPQPKVGDTIKLYGPIGQFNSTPQMKNGYIEEINGKKPSVNSSNPPASSSNAKMVTEPKTGVAYKFGLNQTTKGSIYYFTGTMSGFYGATQNDASKAVDVYLEKSGSGYKIYFTDSKGVKQYIKLEQSGTHYNFTFGAEGSVFTWDAEKNSMHAPCGDQECYMGTYGNYVTFGCLTTEKLKDSDYVAHFYTVE